MIRYSNKPLLFKTGDLSFTLQRTVTVRFHPHVHGDFLASNMWICLPKKISITGWWFGTYIIDGI